MLVANKWDLADDRSKKGMQYAVERIQQRMVPCPWASVVFTSATEGMPPLLRLR